MKRIRFFRLVLFTVMACALQAHGLELRAIPEGTRNSDWRLQPPKDLNGYFPLSPSESKEAWQKRAEARRTAMRVALGLWPMPRHTPANAVVHGRRDMGDYTIEKVYFESFPGFYVTGNLYRPVGYRGKRPAVLTPHGHFTDGRFGDAGPDAAKKEFDSQAERFENGGRNQIQARCVQLARMGCIVFNYDMIGYCDSTQISFDLAHRFAKQRPDMNDVHGWGLFSPQAESMLQSVLGMQAYNSIRALDWIEQLPDVDPSRIAVTGASGGGTQTFILGAIDPRPAVLVPAVMVSTAMQGGCTCENASLLRVGSGNVEFAGLIAPRPLCMIAANDWTREMETKGFPELQALYQQLGVADRVELHSYLQFGHNYNYVSRAAMYDFLQRQFQLDCPQPIVEQEFTRLTAAELSVWDSEHPRPVDGPEVEREILRKWTRDSAEQLAAVRPRDAAALKAYRALVEPAWQTIFNRQMPGQGEVQFEPVENTPTDFGAVMTGTLRYRPVPQDGGLVEQVELLPIAAVFPSNWDHAVAAIWLDEAGKAGLLRDGQLRPEVAKLVQQGIAVVGVDLMEQGEHCSGDMPLTQTRRVDNDREAACYTLGYNASLFAQRVQDVLTLLSFAVRNDHRPDQLYLIGLGNAGPWAAAGRALASEHVERAIIDTRGFRFLNVNDVRDPQLLPGAAKYDDLPGLLALGAPGRLVLLGETGDSAQLVKDAYAAAKAANRLVFGQADQDPIELLLHAY